LLSSFCLFLIFLFLVQCSRIRYVKLLAHYQHSVLYRILPQCGITQPVHNCHTEHRNICVKIYKTCKHQRYPSCCVKWIAFCIASVELGNILTTQWYNYMFSEYTVLHIVCRRLVACHMSNNRHTTTVVLLQIRVTFNAITKHRLPPPPFAGSCFHGCLFVNEIRQKNFGWIFMKFWDWVENESDEELILEVEVKDKPVTDRPVIDSWCETGKTNSSPNSSQCTCCLPVMALCRL